MKKHPMRVLGMVFARIALAEAAVVLLLALFVRDNHSAVFAFSLTLGIQAVVFGSIGAGFLWHVHRCSMRREQLISAGCYETGHVVDLQPSYGIRINRQHPWYVICHIDRDGTLHEYRSDMLFNRPALEIGAPIRVYLDRQNDDRYYVDVENAASPIIRHG